jgi:ectoine hydroxylase-related dioxygenase (phytanoyl-CoA dioxygenase family)
MKLTRAITPDEVQSYQVAGVVLLRGVLDLATVNLMRASIDEGVKTIGASPAGYDLTDLGNAFDEADAAHLADQSSGQHDVAGIMAHIRQSGKELLRETMNDGTGSFLLDTALAARNERFRRLILSGPFAEIAGALLASDEVRYYGDQLFVKEPRTRQRTAFHQDATYFNIEGDDCCVLWVPVDPVKLETGAIQYVRGSHRDGRYYAPNVFISQTPLPGAEEDPMPDIEGNEDKFDIVHFDTEPGDVLVHHYRTLHGAGGNLSRYQVRRAASIRYVGDDIRYKTRAAAPRQLHLRSTFADGDRLCEPDFPVVWRRSIGKQVA